MIVNRRCFASLLALLWITVGVAAKAQLVGGGPEFIVDNVQISGSGLASTTFSFEDLSESRFLPKSFVEGDFRLHAQSVRGRIQHNDFFSNFFQGVSGGALVDPFRLTQEPGYPPESLTLMFSTVADGLPSRLTSFQANFGVIVDTGVFDVSVPAKLRLDAYFGESLMGSVIADPLGGPPFYAGVVAFSLDPRLGASFDRVVLTSSPVPEPAALTLGALGVAVLLLVAWRRERWQ